MNNHETHWGVRYLTGFVSDFHDDAVAATLEYEQLVCQGVRGVELVQRRVGPWHRARAQGGNK
jgi:hypothetical protein